MQKVLYSSGSKIFQVIVFACLFAFVVSCNNSGDPEQTSIFVSPSQSATAHETATEPPASSTRPAVTVEPIPSVAETPVSVPPTSFPDLATASPVIPLNGDLGLLAPSDIDFEGRCLGSLDRGLGSNGTAPGPTATPVNSGQTASLEDIERAYLKSRALAKSFSQWTDWFVTAWGLADSSPEKAYILDLMGSRVSRLCSAFLAVRAPVDVESFTSVLAETLKLHHELMLNAALELQCCGEVTEDIRFRFGLMRLNTAEVLDVMEQSGTETGIDSKKGTYEVSNIDLGFDISIVDDWVLDRDSGFLVAIAPPVLQYSGEGALGPEWWGLGTAVKTRRLRNSSPLTVWEARDRFENLVNSFGEIRSESSAQIGGLDSVKIVLDNQASNWRSIANLVVSGRYTYFLISGCPQKIPKGCDVGETLFDSVEFQS